MPLYRLWRATLLGVVSLAVTPAAVPAGTALALDEAVSLALAGEDPALLRFQARAQALEEAAVADAQLPDPQITAAMANLPLDSFSLGQAEMTQLQLGLRQSFPAGDTLALRGERRHREAAVERMRMTLAARRIALDTRLAWLELYFRERAAAIVDQSAEAVGRNIDSLSARFATGRMHAQDALRAELELALFHDQAIEHRRQADSARRALARWIGDAALRPLPEALPALPVPAPLAVLSASLPAHPRVLVEAAEAEVADRDVALAEQAYRPTLALEGSYGLRTEYADFGSLGLTVSLPLFTDRRQDRRLAAAVQQRGAERLDRDLALRELQRDLEQAWSDWTRLNERAALYRETVRERARQTADAAMSTYASDLTDFAELIRSELAELDTRVRQLQLETEARKAWARLEYLRGDAP